MSAPVSNITWRTILTWATPPEGGGSTVPLQLDSHASYIKLRQGPHHVRQARAGCYVSHTQTSAGVGGVGECPGSMRVAFQGDRGKRVASPQVVSVQEEESEPGDGRLILQVHNALGDGRWNQASDAMAAPASGLP